MKKNKFIVSVLILTVILIFPLTINAAQINPYKYKSDGPNTVDVKSMYQFGGSVAGVIQIVGTIVSAGTLIIIGIRYVLSSVEEKAEYKERMIPYVIGAVLLFGASNIVNIAYKIFDSNSISREVNYSTIGEIKDALAKDSQYLNNLSDDEITNLYEGVCELYGPFSPEDSVVIEKVISEYNERFD